MSHGAAHRSVRSSTPVMVGTVGIRGVTLAAIIGAVDERLGGLA